MVRSYIHHITAHRHVPFGGFNSSITYDNLVPNNQVQNVLSANSFDLADMLHKFTIFIDSSPLVEDLSAIKDIVVGKFEDLPGTIKVCLLINVILYLLWKIFAAQMQQNATSSVENISAGRVWSLVLSSFSHKSLLHLVMNMYGFLTMGPILVYALGDKVFILTIITSAIVSNIISILWSRLALVMYPTNKRIARKRYEVYLGFSGVNSALLLLYTLIQPKAQFLSPFATLLRQHTTQSSVGQSDGMVGGMEFLRSCLVGDGLGLLVDLLFFSTGLAHSGHLGGFLGGYIMKEFMCRTELGQSLTPWSTRRRLDVDLLKQLQF